MKTLVRVLFFSALILVLATPLFARGAQEVDFLAEFEEALQAEGLSEEDAQAIAEAARPLDWSEGEDADPALIAEALVNARENGAELNAEQNASLALELARNAAELEGQGYTLSEIATATLAAVETLRVQIQEWQAGDTDAILGDAVRDTVRDAATTVAEERGDDNDEPAARETPADDKVPVEPGPGAAEAGDR